MRFLSSSLLLLLLLLFTGCQRKQLITGLKAGYVPPAIMKIAVLEFEGLTVAPEAGTVMSRHVYAELYPLIQFEQTGQAPYLDIMDEEEVSRVFRAKKWDISKVLNEVGLKEVGKALGADLLIYGTVGEYRYKKGLGEDPVLSVHMRAYDVRQSTILWSGSEARTGHFSWFSEDGLGRLSQEVMRELVYWFFYDVSRRLPKNMAKKAAQ